MIAGLDLTHTLPRGVARRAAADPDRVYVRQVNGLDLTYADVDEAARRWASSLRELGVAGGDRVDAMLLPSAVSLNAWLGIALLGGIDAGVNTDFRGKTLRYVPRYVGFEDELPRTPSQRIPKIELRAAALNPNTWDRQPERRSYSQGEISDE